MNAKWITGMVFLVMFIILLFQNQQSVTYRIYFWEVSISQVLLVPGALLIGFFFGLAVSSRKKPRPGRHLEEETFEDSDENEKT